MRLASAGGLVVLAAMLAPAPAHADVVGLFDPEAAQICGGSAHNPNCPPTLLGGACCGLVALGGAGFAFVGFARKAGGSREGDGRR